MPYVQFVLLGEGPTDLALREHIRKLLIWVGATEVVGSAPDFRRLPMQVGRDVESKLRRATELEPGANLFLIHRDADSPDPEQRYVEIQGAVDAIGLDCASVAVVPVQEMEAWLLFDESRVKEAAGNPNSRADLNLPSPERVEDVTDPKDRLEEALIVASGTSGRRRDRFKRRLPSIKGRLLRRLPVQGDIERVPAWQRFREELRDAVQYL